HSGAGKSTLLKLIALLLRATSGEIIFDNTNLATINNRQISVYRRNLGLIFQDPMLLEERNIFNNVALPLVIAGLNYRDIKRRVGIALERVCLIGKENHYPKQLSAGEQQ